MTDNISDPTGQGGWTLLTGVTIPVEGLVLAGVYYDPTPDLPALIRVRLVADIEDRLAGTFPEWHSTDECGQTMGVWPYGGFWVVRHVDEAECLYECRVFPDSVAAHAFYTDVVRGLQDATDGLAWLTTDVPGLLAGDNLLLAHRAGLTYWEATAAFAKDPWTARFLWLTTPAPKRP